MFRLIAITSSAAALLVLAAPVEASAPPVGKLPKGPVTTVRAPKGTLVALALPQLKGLSWRLARPVDGKIITQVGEGDIGASVVITFRAKAAGHTKVIYAATRGESTVARAARTLDVTVD
ncbi:MAG TPA: hypothetical protein VGI77_04875 [Gaiellaceae bacterium]|jgi:hypothetical protein